MIGRDGELGYQRSGGVARKIWQKVKKKKNKWSGKMRNISFRNINTFTSVYIWCRIQFVWGPSRV